MQLFRAHEWLFVIALGASALLSLGATLGWAVGDAVDVDGDGVPDGIDLDGDGLADVDLDAGWVSVLGLGRAPLMVGLFGMTSLFGGIGFVASSAFDGCLPRPFDACASVVVALAGALAINPRFTGLVARLLPPVETYATRASDRRGLTGVVVMRLSEREAEIRVRHDDGTSLRVPAVSDEPLPPVGGLVVVVEHDRARRRDVVTPLPPEAAPLPADPETEIVR